MNDVPAQFTPKVFEKNYSLRVEMIPMRDGVKLKTLIFIPKGAKDAPMLLQRTPYNASRYEPHAQADNLMREGFIRVYQDIRGKYGSEGNYVVTMPVRGPLNPAATDHVTDTWDSIEWLVKNVSESNGRVGHARQLLRWLHYRDGVARSTSGAQGGCASGAAAGCMDGR